MTLLQYLKLIFRVMRPRLVFIHLAGYMIFGSKILGENNNFWFWYNLFLVLIPYSVVIYGINDVYDYDTDIKNPRKQQNWLGSILQKEHQIIIMRSVIGSALFIMGSAILSQNVNLILTYLVMLIFGIIYSMPPIKLKTKPFFDVIANVFIFGLILFVPMTSSPDYLQFIISKSPLITTIAGFYILAALVDYQTDKDCGDSTVATKLGLFWTPILIALLVSFRPIFYPFGNNILNYTILSIAFASGSLIFFQNTKLYNKLVSTIINIIFLIAIVSLAVTGFSNIISRYS